MARHGDRWLVLIVAVVAIGITAGCKKDAEVDEAEPGQATAGGEAPGDTEQPPGSAEPGEDDGGTGTEAGDASGDGAGGEGDEADAAPSPWGKTRAEQCKPPSRKSIGASARTAIDQGVRAAREGNVEGARAAFRQALEADANAYEAAHNLGVLADRAGQSSQALEHYRQALRIQPDYEKAARGVVAIHLRRGDVDEARRFMDAVASQFRANLELQAIHAETLVKAGRFDDAWKAARRALECDERFVPAMVALVKASLKQEREELAESVLDQALGITDRNAELHYLKAQMLLDEEGRLREALKHLRRAVELRPTYLEARMALGVQLLHGGNYEEALEQFQAAERLAPEMVAVHLNLGDAYRATQQWTKAKEVLDRVLQMDPDLAEAHFNLALMYMVAGEEYPELDALQALQKAKEEFQKYRDLMGPRLPRDDPSEQYLEDLGRQVERTKRRLERERAQQEREAERSARQDAEGEGDAADDEGGEP
ncbi:MAG: tetratricopeptide repeat protein [Myxococcota bacterium]